MTTEKSRNAENFSARLAAAMSDAQINQAELARRLDTAWSTVDRWMKGSVPRRKMIQDLSRVLCVASRWLETGEGPRSMSPALDAFAEGNRLREDSPLYRSKTENPDRAMFEKLAATADTGWLLDRIEQLAEDARMGDSVAAATISMLVPLVRARMNSNS